MRRSHDFREKLFELCPDRSQICVVATNKDFLHIIIRGFPQSNISEKRLDCISVVVYRKDWTSFLNSSFLYLSNENQNVTVWTEIRFSKDQRNIQAYVQ